MTHSSLKARLKAVIAAQLSPERKARSYVEYCALEVERWTLVVTLLERQPFATTSHLPRSDQWRRAAARLREAAPCPALLDWMLVQVEVAVNLERRIRDLRPRKHGPCHTLAVAYAVQNRRKAEVVLAWAESATVAGADLTREPSWVFSSADRPGEAKL